jgi:hypothetical protein
LANHERRTTEVTCSRGERVRPLCFGRQFYKLITIIKLVQILGYQGIPDPHRENDKACRLDFYP